jgi:hypothetical protein
MGVTDQGSSYQDSTKGNPVGKRRIRATNQDERHGHPSQGVETLNNGI